MTTLTTLTRVTLACGLGLSLTACMTTTPVYDAHFGESVRTVRAMQTLNPDAPANYDPITHTDAGAAVAAMDRYSKSYVSPPADTNAYTIGIGAATANSMTGQ
jgi:hypothetical protein